MDKYTIKMMLHLHILSAKRVFACQLDMHMMLFPCAMTLCSISVPSTDTMLLISLQCPGHSLGD